MKRLICAAPLAALFLATPALAADFSGFRGEVRGGWDSVELDVDGTDGSKDGIGYGGEIGYDFATGGAVVVGVYGGVDLSTVDVCTEVLGDDEACLEAGRNFTLGVRAGAPVGANALLYAKGGYSNGRVTLDYEDFADSTNDFSVGDSRDGWHVGVGGELALGRNFYGKAEYTYHDYSGADFSDGVDTLTVDSSRHQVLVGIGFRI